MKSSNVVDISRYRSSETIMELHLNVGRNPQGYTVINLTRDGKTAIVLNTYDDHVRYPFEVILHGSFFSRITAKGNSRSFKHGYSAQAYIAEMVGRFALAVVDGHRWQPGVLKDG